MKEYSEIYGLSLEPDYLSEIFESPPRKKSPYMSVIKPISKITEDTVKTETVPEKTVAEQLPEGEVMETPLEEPTPVGISELAVVEKPIEVVVKRNIFGKLKGKVVK